MHRLLPSVCLLLSAIVIAGCSSSNEPKPYPVSGTVTRGGNPVVGANVIFMPVAADGKPAAAITDSEGKYELMTLNPKDGALPGQYRVKVTQYEGPNTPKASKADKGLSQEEFEKQYVEGGSSKEPQNLLPAKYANEATSGFTHTVEKAASTYDIPIPAK